jgi:hypothetical protein
MKKISLILIPFLIIIVVILVQLHPRLSKPQQPEITPVPTKAISLNDLYLVAQKAEALKDINTTEVYFSAVKKPLSANRFYVEIYLSAKEQMRVDGADLVMNFDPNLTISNLQKGSVFPQYPRLIIDNNQIIITGLTSLANNTIKLGEPNQLFASFEVYKNNPAQTSIIAVDQNSTKAFLNGEYVLNQAISFSQLSF